MRGIWLVAFALSLSACQCVQLPADLKCTPDQCAPDRCGDDGRCHGVSDAGCVASTSCALAGLECGLLDTGCGEEACGTCNAGSTCGTFQPGQCAPCDPDVFDFPDPNFVDSNCDGIDGTVDGGLFVDPVIGSDGPFGTGQRDAPLRSLGRAQAVISRRSGDPIHTVFIAEGFLDGLTWDQPVSLAGGYRAITWARSALAVTTIQRQDVGLRLEGLPATVLVTGLTIEGLTSSTPGIATVGLWVFDSPVSLRTLVVRAQGGAAGADGAPGLPGTPGGDGAAGPQGESGPLGCGRFCTSASAGLPADGGAGACGPGGEGAASPNISMATIRPVDDLFASVLGCRACPCPAADGGFELRRGADADGGSAGLDGDAGLPSASLTVAVGQVDGGWWSPTAPPPPGTDGLNGVGGTGGLAGGSAIYQEGTSYSQVAFGSVGGGGGAPGCGGRAGQSGAPGGPSIGLIVSGASPSFLGVSIITGKGGPGGNAGAGGVGGRGGNGGPGGRTYQATCDATSMGLSFTPPLLSPGPTAAQFFGGAGGPGGRGGNGGRGGDGAPGAGGPSIGVWCERRALETFPVPQLGPGGDGGVGPGGLAGPGGRAIDFLNCR